MADVVAPPRPRPRPRPRPKAKSPAKSATPAPATENGASTSTSPPTRKPSAITEDDIDAMFMKNRNRSAQTWAKLEEMNKDEKKKDAGSGSESDGDEDASPRSRKRVRKREALPKAKWQKDAELLRMLSKEPESDSDSDGIEIQDGAATPTGRARRQQQPRQRSRSRSLTPPPVIPQQQVEKVRNFVRQALGESSSVTILPPAEFGVRDQTPQTGRASSRATPAAEEDEDTIQIDVTWKPHPLDKFGKEFEWQYRIGRRDNFQELFEAIADDANVVVDNLVVCYQGKRIFASVNPGALNIWSDVRFTAYAKPSYDYIRTHTELPSFHGLGSQQPQTQAPSRSAQRDAGGPSIDISDSDGDDQPSPPPTRYNTTSQSQTQSHGGGSQSQSQSQSHTRAQSVADDDEDGNKLKLVLRSALTGDKDITLTVRPTAKCGNILRAFLKKAGLDAQYPHIFSETPVALPPTTGAKRGRGGGRKNAKVPAAAPAAVPLKDPRLCVDGDKMDNETPISEADLDDGDMVEVVGL